MIDEPCYFIPNRFMSPFSMYKSWGDWITWCLQLLGRVGSTFGRRLACNRRRRIRLTSLRMRCRLLWKMGNKTLMSYCLGNQMARLGTLTCRIRRFLTLRGISMLSGTLYNMMLTISWQPHRIGSLSYGELTKKVRKHSQGKDPHSRGIQGNCTVCASLVPIYWLQESMEQSRCGI